jgi:hypothetical protein
VTTTTDVVGLGTEWLRHRLDVTHKRVPHIETTTVAHFMTQAWSGFNSRAHIGPRQASAIGGDVSVSMPDVLP